MSEMQELLNHLPGDVRRVRKNFRLFCCCPSRGKQLQAHYNAMCDSGQSALMGRDPDSKWADWLALSRHNNPGSASGTLSKASSNIGDSKPIRSRSSATSYFALLSANENGSNDDRSFANYKQHGNVSGLTTRDMDSSWVACFAERSRQRQLADTPDTMIQENAHGSEHSFLEISKTLSPSEPHQLQMPQNSLPQDPESAFVSNTTTTTTPSAVPSSVGTMSPLPSPLNNYLDFDIDSLGTEFLSNFCTTLPFDPTDTQANGAAGLCTTAGLDDGDTTWLEGQHAFPLNISDGLGKSTPTSKRSREQYPGDYTNDGQIHLGNNTNKKQKMSHPWTNRLETSPPYPSSVLRPSR